MAPAAGENENNGRRDVMASMKSGMKLAWRAALINGIMAIAMAAYHQ